VGPRHSTGIIPIIGGNDERPVHPAAAFLAAMQPYLCPT